MNTKQIILFSLDKTNNKIDEFTYQVSNTQKIYLKRNIKEDYFSEEIVSIKLDKKIIYKEKYIKTVKYYLKIFKKNENKNSIKKAMEWSISKGSYSGRTALQFVNNYSDQNK